MALHPNVISLSDMMLRLRGLKPMATADANYLRKCGWTVGKPATYATCSAKMANGNRLEATVMSTAQLWIDVHNDGPSYNIAHRVPTGHIVGAAVVAVAMLQDLRAGASVAPEYQNNMTTAEA